MPLSCINMHEKWLLKSPGKKVNITAKLSLFLQCLWMHLLNYFKWKHILGFLWLPLPQKGTEGKSQTMGHRWHLHYSQLWIPCPCSLIIYEIYSYSSCVPAGIAVCAAYVQPACLEFCSLTHRYTIPHSQREPRGPEQAEQEARGGWEQEAGVETKKYSGKRRSIWVIRPLNGQADTWVVSDHQNWP